MVQGGEAEGQAATRGASGRGRRIGRVGICVVRIVGGGLWRGGDLLGWFSC